MDRTQLLRAATEYRDKSFSPYSRFKVGAAVLSSKGKIYGGCNIENDSYGLSLCAERIAIFKAISEGERGIRAVAVVTDNLEFSKPCGACRQVFIQFGDDVTVLMSDTSGRLRTVKASKLLPESFSLS